MPMRTDILRESEDLACPSAVANAVFPPLLRPDRANLVKSATTFSGSRDWRPFGNQFMTFAPNSISSGPLGGTYPHN
ncbi:hypothetical protein ACFX15_007600 [Malus domestica]